MNGRDSQVAVNSVAVSEIKGYWGEIVAESNLHIPILLT
jgi:hypothetical protein